MEPTDIRYRKAEEADLPALVDMLSEDPLGSERESPGLPLAAEYAEAFAAIAADDNQLLAVAVDGDRVVGTLQITFIPGLARLGTMRGQIEAVRIAASHRGRGLGERFFKWAIEQCRQRGCGLVQLTTDKSRPDAHRFYDRLGFIASHVGYKLQL